MVEIRPLRPRMSSVVMSRRSPLTSWIAPFSILPVLIFGPCRSARMPILLARCADNWRIVSIRWVFSSWEPWEKLRRKTSAPASISRLIISGEELAGPSVEIIFVLRKVFVMLVVKPSLSLFMAGVGRLVAFETLEFFHFAQIEN